MPTDSSFTVDSAPVPDLSVIIPAYNEERNLPPLLAFLQQELAALPIRVEVLIDVSGSTDGTAAFALDRARSFPGLRLIDTGHRDGLLEALSRLVASARAPLLLRVDADIQIAPGTVVRLLEKLQDPSVGIASPRLGFVPGRSRIVNHLHEAYLEIHHQVSCLSPKTTVVQLFRRLTGPLPTDAGAEDVALQELVESTGLRAAYVPEGMAMNSPPATLREWLRQQVRYVRQLAKHAERGYPASPSTARVPVLLLALGRTLAEGKVSRENVLLFLAGELTVRSLAAAGPLVRISGSFGWEPVEGTKELNWGPFAPTGPSLRESQVRSH
jgi:cellulose synthase/poly-beta-1,6-N-acetylglucosamine synthase-like glycosyltransferase